MPATILLSCESISKRYGLKTLFEQLSLSLFEGEQVGLVGPNGAGKSTLLKIMAGLELPDSGTRTLRRQIRLGYVPQLPTFAEESSVEQVLAAGLRAEGLDPHEQGGRLARALSIGQFPDLEQPVATLSGGWRKRLAITQACLLEPDILLMDEPTNHLDVEGILWLESLLTARARAFLVVSHDRRFLESVTTRMIELNRRYASGFFEAQGTYSAFLEQRDALHQTQADYQASLANRVRREVDWLRRGPKARTTKAKARIQSAQSLIEELEGIETRTTHSRTEIDFTASGRQSKQLLVGQGLSMTRNGRPLFRDLDLHLGPGQRVGLLGPNGSGKTTLLRLLAGTLDTETGTITRAERLRIVFFEQHRESLDQSLSLRRTLAPAGDAVVYQDRSVHIVAWAKRFLFRPEQLDLPVSRLSGGEQARLLMARLMLEPADLLILDEPTNDLDIPTLDVLGENLLEFPGALVLVTHDRWLLDRVSTVLLALDGAGRAEWFADIAQWETAYAKRTADEAEARKREARQRSAATSEERPKPRTKKLTYREQQEWDRIEVQILDAEARLASCRTAANDPSVVSDAAELSARCTALEAAEGEVARLYARWAELDQKQASQS